MKVNQNKVQILVKANPLRTHLIIGNITDATLYIRKDESTYDEFLINGFPLKLDGLLELQGVECYKGTLYAVSDTNDTDVRVLEL